ncbi:MAG: GWxTD domain-containing protein [Bacteroidia bacterium]|nr:GWxTD domain-containing protein [Bacteroidia bacterium]
MKKLLVFAFFALYLGAVRGGDIKGYFNYNLFNIPGASPFLETYLTINGSSVIYKKLENGKFQGSLEVSIALFRKDSVFAPKKYLLFSPEVSDTSDKRPSFIDQQRISVPNGIYALEMSVSDPNSASKKKFTVNERIEIKFPESEIVFSDVQLLEKFSKSTNPTVITKSGYDLIPYSVSTYTDAMTRLAFYAEAYNVGKILGNGERFAFFYFIENFETKQKVEGYAGFDKQTAANVNVLLAQMEIQKLRSGNYNLVLEVKDQFNKLLSQKRVFFQRKNSVTINPLADLSTVNADSSFIKTVTNADTLADFIRCIWPVSSVSDREYAANVVKNKDVKQMQKYFYAFWKNHNDVDPEGEWKKYYKQVLIVNTIFAAGKIKGYATDRGRVYLQFGTPNSRNEVLSENNTYPYEIWQYYTLTDPGTGQIQRNKMFIFCNNEIAGNKYKLIHSDARGEMFDARWRLKIMKRTVQGADLDFEKPGGTYGNALDDNFSMPK